MDAKYITRDDMVRRIISRMGGQCQEIEMVVEEDRGLGHVHMAIEDTEDYSNIELIPDRFFEERRQRDLEA